MKIKNAIENYILRKYFRAIVKEDVLTEDKYGRIYIKGELVDVGGLKNLQEEAKLITRTELWSILTNTLLSQADNLLKNKSITFDDVRHSKMMMYNISIMESILNKLKKLELDKKG